MAGIAKKTSSAWEQAVFLELGFEGSDGASSVHK
jgi:hypothetical protein